MSWAPEPDITNAICMMLSHGVPMGTAVNAHGFTLNQARSWIRYHEQHPYLDPRASYFTERALRARAEYELEVISTTSLHKPRTRQEALELLQLTSPENYRVPKDEPESAPAQLPFKSAREAIAHLEAKILPRLREQADKETDDRH